MREKSRILVTGQRLWQYYYCALAAAVDVVRPAKTMLSMRMVRESRGDDDENDGETTATTRRIVVRQKQYSSSGFRSLSRSLFHCLRHHHRGLHHRSSQSYSYSS